MGRPLEGKVAVVAGGTRGAGRGISKELSRPRTRTARCSVSRAFESWLMSMVMVAR